MDSCGFGSAPTTHTSGCSENDFDFRWPQPPASLARRSLGEGGTPEPKRIVIGLITQKGKLSPATEKFCACAKEAFAAIR
jgi:hypothetical protein